MSKKFKFSKTEEKPMKDNVDQMQFLEDRNYQKLDV